MLFHFVVVVEIPFYLQSVYILSANWCEDWLLWLVIRVMGLVRRGGIIWAQNVVLKNYVILAFRNSAQKKKVDLKENDKLIFWCTGPNIWSNSVIHARHREGLLLVHEYFTIESDDRPDTVVGIRHADHVATSIRESWH
jgi:hypothetical protein